ncbi:hypothetical protein [Gryllotalpicola koreensis]|uniref:Uncharacterized protein n=1 Tax=Gryllotalpicola koreensis TaxID=993086 RepID=A0ABP8A1Q5_9MICO
MIMLDKQDVLASLVFIGIDTSDVFRVRIDAKDGVDVWRLLRDDKGRLQYQSGRPLIDQEHYGLNSDHQPF